MIWGLPESLQFLAVSGRSRDELARWLQTARSDDSRRCGHASSSPTRRSRQGVPFVHLFRDGRGIVDAPAVGRQLHEPADPLLALELAAHRRHGHGLQTQTAVLVGTVLQVGGTIGTFGLAWLIARGGFIPMLAATFALATVSIALIGQPGISLAMLTVIVFVAGWGVIGGQPGINALSATYYPTSSARPASAGASASAASAPSSGPISVAAARAAMGTAGTVLGGRGRPRWSRRVTMVALSSR